MLAELHGQGISWAGLSINSYPCAECFGNLPTHIAHIFCHLAQSSAIVVVLAAGLSEVLDTAQSHVADSWTDKPAAASPGKMCD